MLDLLLWHSASILHLWRRWFHVSERCRAFFESLSDVADFAFDLFVRVALVVVPRLGQVRIRVELGAFRELVSMGNQLLLLKNGLDLIRIETGCSCRSILSNLLSFLVLTVFCMF